MGRMGRGGRSSLVMVGTVHRDPRGYGKLYRFLKQEEPALITVEVSPYARAFRAKQSATLRAALRENLRRIGEEEGRPLKEIISHGGVFGIFFLLREPYEWKAAEAYACRHGIDIEDIDLSSYSQDRLSHLSELIALENLRALLHVPFPDLSQQVEAHYRRARFLFSHPPVTWPEEREVQEREACMADKIRSHCHALQGNKMLHIGGWEHLVEFRGGKSLLGLLSDLHPTRYLLWNRKPFNQREG